MTFIPPLPPDGSPPVPGTQTRIGEEPPEIPEEAISLLPPDDEEEEEGGRHESVIPSLMPVKGGSGWIDDYDPRQELLSDGNKNTDSGRQASQIDLRTEVNELQILQMARGRALASYFGIEVLHKFIDDILRLSVSKDRKSRKEFVDSIKHGDNILGANIQGNPLDALKR